MCFQSLCRMIRRKRAGYIFPLRQVQDNTLAVEVFALDADSRNRFRIQPEPASAFIQRLPGFHDQHLIPRTGFNVLVNAVQDITSRRDGVWDCAYPLLVSCRSWIGLPPPIRSTVPFVYPRKAGLE